MQRSAKDAGNTSGANDIAAALKRAMTLHQAGRLDEAEDMYRQVLARNPRQFEALHFFGVLEAQRGRNEEAHHLIGSSLQIDQSRPEAFVNHARVLLALERHKQAIASSERALALNPRSVEALTYRGHGLRALKRAEQALASYQRVLTLAPNHAPALVNRGNAQSDLGRLEDAVASYDAALRLAPQMVEAWNARGAALHRLKRFNEALESYDNALRAKPDHADVWNNRGYALNALKRFEEAMASYDKALNLKPDHADAISNRGVTLESLGRVEEAEREYDRALALSPGLPSAQWNKFLRSMASGRLAEGWALCESRWTATIPDWQSSPPRAYSAPQWDGQRVAGTLLVWGEQGLGDQILHASMAPDLGSYADHVVIEVAPRLVELFSRSFPGAQIEPLGVELYRGPIAAHVAIASIGRYLRPTLEAFEPHRRSYLTADAARAARLRERLASDGQVVVGISWRSVNPGFGAAKSADLRDFAAVLRCPGCRFIDLQYGDTIADRTAVEADLGIAVERLEDIDNMNDIDGLAALITACDAVVTVSNTTAHLAGALGRPTWVLVPHGHARLWYWFGGRADSPWYPSVQLRPQGKDQPWAELIASIEPEVSTLRSGGR